MRKEIGQIVTKNYHTAQVFKSFGIDYCCNGNRTVEEACTSMNIPATEVYSALNKVSTSSPSEFDKYDQWPLDLLADYIEKIHHSYVRNKYPEITSLLEKLCLVHGKKHPELLEVKQLFAASIAELEVHMTKEEKILFPLVRHLATSNPNSNPNKSPSRVSDIKLPIRQMLREHDNEGERYRTISKLTNSYQVPEDACNTYRVCYAMLEEFESNLHKHIHLENNILFQRALEQATDSVSKHTVS